MPWSGGPEKQMSPRAFDSLSAWKPRFKDAGPPHAAQGGAEARAPLSEEGAPGTDLHSPAGVRPKFGHSLEHIVLRKKPPPPGKETEAGGVAAALRGPAPPARAQAKGFRPRAGESPARVETRNRRLAAGVVHQTPIQPARRAEREGRR